MDLKEVGNLVPEENWYYRHKLRMVSNVIAKSGASKESIIDVGAGSGFFSIQLHHSMGVAKTICVDPGYVQDSTEDDGSIEFLRQNPRTAADIYLLMDVLEHVEDDEALLDEYVATARPGAVFVISVPAFMSLWSGHDIFLEHHRRYRLKEIEQVAEACGLQIEFSRYLFTPLFPPIWLVRRIRGTGETRSDMRPMPRALNRALELFLRLDSILALRIIPGSTALVLGRKVH